MRIYRYKQLYKPDKAITVCKKEERNINFVTIMWGGGAEKNEWGDLKSFCHAGYLSGGLLCFLSFKDFKDFQR